MMVRLFARLLLLSVVVGAAVVGVAAQQPCATCGKVHATSTLPGQAIAQSRANYMARTGIKKHPPLSAGHWPSVGRFEGVGWSSARVRKEQVPTCRPSGRTGVHPDHTRRLVGDAVAYGPGGSFRVRIWR